MNNEVTENNKNAKCLIISGGDKCSFYEDRKDAALIIACDKGADYAKQYGLKPDVIIGDFDSCENVEAADALILRYPEKKDDTDTMLAARYALDHGFTDIAIICAFGGRLDHAFANIQTGAFIAQSGGRAALFGADTESYIMGPGSISVPEKKGWSLSCFSVSEACDEVSIFGTKYEIQNAGLSNTFPVGVSNVWRGNGPAVISHKKGILMVMCSKLKAGEHI